MKNFKGAANRTEVKIELNGKMKSQRALLDDLNAAMNGTILFDSSEKAAAEALVAKSNGQIFIHSRVYMRLSSMWVQS